MNQEQEIEQAKKYLQAVDKNYKLAQEEVNHLTDERAIAVWQLCKLGVRPIDVARLLSVSGARITRLRDKGRKLCEN